MLAVLLAGCFGPAADRDGKAFVYVVNAGPPVFVKITGEEGVAWSARLAEREGRLAELPVDPGHCGDFTVLAGYNGTEPHVPVRLVAPCDWEAAALRVEVRPPDPRPDQNVFANVLPSGT